MMIACILGGVPLPCKAPFIILGTGCYFSFCATLSPALYFIYRTPEIFCSVRLAALLLALLREWADARTGRAFVPWSMPGLHLFLFCLLLLEEWNSNRRLRSGVSIVHVRFSCNGTSCTHTSVAKSRAWYNMAVSLGFVLTSLHVLPVVLAKRFP
jgi:hypothetical protein